MNPSWFSCTNGGDSLAPVSASTIGPLLCSKTAIDLLVAGNQRDVEGIIRLAVRSLPRLHTTSHLQREGSPLAVQPPARGASSTQCPDVCPFFSHNLLLLLLFSQIRWKGTVGEEV